jgi:hypothetical protein
VLPLSLSYPPGNMWRRPQHIPFLNAAAINMLRARLRPKERAMVRLYLAGCFHHWEDLPGTCQGRCLLAMLAGSPTG